MFTNFCSWKTLRAVSREFLLHAFSWINFLHAPENLRRYSQVKVHHRRVANNMNNIRLIMHKSEHEEKFLSIFNSTTQRCAKYLNFSDWKSFLFATGVNEIGSAPWAANISANFRKFKTAPMGYSGAWLKLIHEKNLKSKISLNVHFLFD